MTHDQLVERGVKWLRSAASSKKHRYRGSCGVVVPELVSSASESPDVIGWQNGGVSHMIECKVSRADFKADAKKWHRNNGAGAYRWFLCPPHLIQPDELLGDWGLLYCHPKRITVEVDSQPNPGRNHAAELSMMYSLLRRVDVRGNLECCLAPKWGGDSTLKATAC